MGVGSVGLAAAGVLAVLGGVACSSTAGESSSASSTATTTAAADVATAAPAPAGQTFAVGRRDLTLVDSSRPTDADPNRGQPAQESRTIETVVLYPADGDAGQPAQVDAPPAAGSFPLVVFSHGLNGSGEIYAPLVEPVARAGYVVVFPTFPLTSGPVPMQGDVVNQPADVSFVIDEIFRMSRDQGSWLGGHLDRQRVAAAGHSMGAVTTLGLAYNDCCLDDRVDAAISVSGGPLDYPEGNYTWPETALLLVHGERDQIVPVAGSDSVFDTARGPTWYLRFAQADHYGVGLGADGALTMQAAVAFLDATLKDSPQPLEAMSTAVSASGRAEWRTAHVADS